MNFLSLNNISTDKSMINNFMGYFHNLQCADGYFYDEENLSSEVYPAIKPIKDLEALANIPNNVKAMKIVDGEVDDVKKTFIVYTTKTGSTNKVVFMYADTLQVYREFSLTGTEENNNIVLMGVNVCVFPVGWTVNTLTWESEYFEYEKTGPSSDSSIFCSPCTPDGEVITRQRYTGSTTPTGAQDGEIWQAPLKVNGVDFYTFKVYSASTAMWSEMEWEYVIWSNNPQYKFDSFKEGEAVDITFNWGSTNYKFHTIITKLVKQGQGGIMIQRDRTSTQFCEVPVQTDGIANLKITRKMPKLDFVIESNNRLWGCRYGNQLNYNAELKDYEEVFVNEIYASALGKPSSWYSYQGTATDSYAVSMGTQGEFTGAINFRGYPTFFKENSITRISGSFPAQYTINNTQCRGVEKGADKTVAIVDEILFFKSPFDICTYSGSLPESISEEFGNEKIQADIGFGFNSKYYIRTSDGVFVYDTKKAIWHKMTNAKFESPLLHFLNIDNKLYVCNSGETTNKISSFSDDSYSESMFETGEIGFEYADQKYLQRIDIRIDLDLDTEFELWVKYDSEEWEMVYSLTGEGKTGSELIPFCPQRCDHLRLKIVVDGGYVLYSITKTIERGGTDDNN